MIEAKKLKLGLFIVFSFTLLIIALLFLGLKDQFREKYEFFTVFDESVQGLEKGAAIKYKGVTIGKVTKISVWKDRYVKVDMEAEPGSISPDSSSNQSLAQNIKDNRDFLKREVAKGLRCSLEISSLATGLKFIELTHIDFSRKREVHVEVEDQSRFVPAMQSLLSGAITNFDKTLTNIAKVDYEGIGIEAKKTMLHLNRILADPKISSLISKGDTAVDKIIIVAQNLNTKIEELQINKLQTNALTMISNVDKNLSALITNADKSLNSTIAQLNSRLKISLDNFDLVITGIKQELKDAKLADTAKITRETLNKASKAIDEVTQETKVTLTTAKTFFDDLKSLNKDITKALNSVEGAGNSVAGLRKDLASTLKRFKTTLDSVSSFIDYLESDPSALIRGKAQE